MLRKKKDPLRKGFEILRDVRLLKDKLNRIQTRIDERAEELTKKLVELQMKGDNYLSRRYAEEIANLKNLSKRLAVLMFILDKVDLAVQHAIVRYEFNTLAMELSGLIREVSKLPETKIPDLGVLFADLEENIRELSDMDYTDLPVVDYNPPTNSEVKAILEEAKAALKEKLEPAS